jgi:hypothetical protein
VSGSLADFVGLMRANVPEDSRIMLCQFRGSPTDDIKGKWRAYVLNRLDQIDEKANVYLCVSAMRKNARGEFRRRKENFAGGLLLMIDDLGEGAAAKFPMSTLDPLPPTALVETSPANYQAIYMFKELVSDEGLFSRLIRAFIDKEFLGNDPGMAGVNRVFRPPVGINGKPKHGNWPVRLAAWNPEARYSPQDLVEAFDLTLQPPGRKIPRGASVNKSEAIRAFVSVRQSLKSAGMLKRNHADQGGWQDVRCPWTHEHTNAVDNGAAIGEPSEENGWTGAFKCHHGACQERGWRDVTEWLGEEQAEYLELVNANAKEWSHYNDR